MRPRLLHNLLILTIILISVNLYGQTNKDSVRTMKYFLLFDKYEYTDTLKAKAYADSGIVSAKKSKNYTMIGKAYRYMGWYFQDRGKFKIANDHFYKSLGYLRKAGDKQGIADAYGNLGNSYLDVEDYQNSLNNQLLSLTTNEEIINSNPGKEALLNAKLGRSYALHNIGAIYSDIHMYDKALEYEFKSMIYEIEAGNKTGQAISYNTLATIHKNLNRVDSSEYYFRKAMDLYKENSHPYGEASTLLEYATLDGAKLSEDQRVEMIKKSLNIRMEQGDKDGEARTLIDICTAYFDQISTDSLSRILERTYEIIEVGEMDNLLEDYFKIYAKYKSRIGEYETAFFALENYLELKAVSDEKRRMRELIVGDVKHQLQTKFQNDSLQAQNDFALKHAEQVEEIAQIQNVVYLGVIGFIILIASLFFFISSNRRKNRLNEVLSEKNTVIQEQKNTVDEKNRSISDSINYARRLQTAILPTSEQINKFLPESFLFFKPKDVVSGDFHWFENKGDLIFLAVADCTGHGVPGAMVSVVCSNALNRTVNEFGLIRPKDILDKTRQIVVDTFAKSGDKVNDGMDISLISINKKTRKIIFAGAQNSLFIIRDNEKFDASQFDEKRLKRGVNKSLMEFKGDKQPIGLYEEMKKFTELEIDLEETDIVYMFSDGYADQFGGDRGKKFKYGPLKQLLLENSELQMDVQKKRLVETFESWRGDHDQIDDICVMGIRVFNSES